MPNIVLSILGKDSSSSSTKSAAGNLEQLQAKRENAARALVAANKREADSAGRARVADVQLAEARAKYAADSSQVVRAEERVAASHRSLETASANAVSASQRLEGAQRRMAAAESDAASAAESAARRTRTAFDGIGDAASRMGVKAAGGLQNVASKVLSLGGNIAKNAAGTAAGLLVYDVGARAAGAAFDFAKGSVIDFNVQLENADIAFTTMLGSGKRSKVFLDQLQTFARETPFEFPDLITASQRLLAMGVRAKDVIPYLTGIGDAAAASGKGAAGVDQITTAIGQMTAKGKVQGDEILQLTEAGIPALRILADAYGVSTQEISKMISKGQVLSSKAVPELIKGLEKGTKTTAGFGGMMDKQSKTFTGAVSNISDALNQTMGSAFRPFFKLIERGAINVSKFVGSKGFQKWAADTSKALDGLLSGGGLTDFFKSIGSSGTSKAADRFLRTFEKNAKLIGPAFQDIAPDVESFIKDTLPPLIEILTKLIAKTPEFLSNWRDLASFLKDSGPTIAGVIGFLGDFATALIDASTAARNFAKDAAKNFQDFRDNVDKFFSGAIDWLVDAGKNIIQGLVNGITGNGDLVGAALNAIAESAKAGFKAALKIQSPSKVFQEFGKFISQGLAVGIREGSADDVQGALDEMVDRVKSSYDDLSSEVKSARDTVKSSGDRADRADETIARASRQKRAAEQRLAAAKTERQRTAAENALKDIEARRRAAIKERQDARDDLADAKDLLRKDRSAKARQAAEKKSLDAIKTANDQLKVLAADRDTATADLEAAQQRLDDALSTRDSYRADISSGVLGLGNISTTFGAARDAQKQALTDLVDLRSQLADVQKQLTETDVPDTVADLVKQRDQLLSDIGTASNTAAYGGVQALLDNVRKQADDADEFKDLLAKLKSQGLDDTSYKQLVDDYAGGSGLDAARGLLGSGGDNIRQLANLQARLKASSDALGLSTSSSLYQAGVDSAQGFVDGLNSKIADLTSTMTSIADAMVKTIKTQLGIKSPSTVFRAQGVFVTQGLVQGLLAGKSDIAGAVNGLVPTTVGVPNVAGAGTSGGRNRAGVYIGQLNMRNGATAPELVAALDWMGRTQT